MFNEEPWEEKHNKETDTPLNDKGHALVEIFVSSPSSWILDYRASNHMESYKKMFPSTYTCTNPTILGDALVQIIHLAEEEYLTNLDEHVINIFLHCIGELVTDNFVEKINQFKSITQLRESLSQIKFILMNISLISI